MTMLMIKFKQSLCPKSGYYRKDKLNYTLYKSKKSIVSAIDKGIQFFYFGNSTCLQPDWSWTNFTIFYSQKYCSFKSVVPRCCQTEWLVVLVNSHFLKPLETSYAALDKKALQSIGHLSNHSILHKVVITFCIWLITNQ